VNGCRVHRAAARQRAGRFPGVCPAADGSPLGWRRGLRSAGGKPDLDGGPARRGATLAGDRRNRAGGPQNEPGRIRMRLCTRIRPSPCARRPRPRRQSALLLRAIAGAFARGCPCPREGQTRCTATSRTPGGRRRKKEPGCSPGPDTCRSFSLRLLDGYARDTPRARALGAGQQPQPQRASRGHAHTTAPL